MAPSWTPILDGSLFDGAVHTTAVITADLKCLEPKNLAASKSDLALYFAYLTLAGWQDHSDHAEAWLDAAIDDVATGTLGPPLYGGLTGVAWVGEHIAGLPSSAEADEVPDALSDDGDANEEVDALLVSILTRGRPWLGSYDLVAGLVGIGIYFLERLPHVRAREGLETVIARLDELAERDDDGVRWYTPAGQLPPWQLRLAPDGCYNLGMAHGIPGVIALLAHCIAHHIATDASERLLHGAITWLLAHRRNPPDDSWFGSWIALNAPQPGPSRLAWCYGDLGVAVAMMSAGLAVGEALWTDTATQVAVACSERSRSLANVNDAGLCHGAAGVAHIFNHLFQVTGDLRLRAAALDWYAATLEFHGSAGYGGYQTYRAFGIDGMPLDSPWSDDASFLTGSAGIGIALLAACTAVPPEWDRLLMIAPPLWRSQRCAELLPTNS
jgi:lantibiotic biosynthesis protein